MAQQRRPAGRSESPGSQSPEARAAPGTTPSAANVEGPESGPSEEAKRKTPSTVDAMGQDKRRQVVGHSYGPSLRSQIMFFVAVAAVIVVLVGGWLALLSLFDKPPTHFSDRAPWSTTPTSPQLAVQQKAKPISPLSPCGEPGNEYPTPARSPCAPPSKANAFQGASPGQ